VGDRCARCAASQRSNTVKQSFVAAQRLQPPLRGGRSRGRTLRALRRVEMLEQRIKLMEQENRGGIDISKFCVRPEIDLP
jgi:hypothetical protein